MFHILLPGQSTTCASVRIFIQDFVVQETKMEKIVVFFKKFIQVFTKLICSVSANRSFVCMYNTCSGLATSFVNEQHPLLRWNIDIRVKDNRLVRILSLNLTNGTLHDPNIEFGSRGLHS